MKGTDHDRIAIDQVEHMRSLRLRAVGESLEIPRLTLAFVAGALFLGLSLALANRLGAPDMAMATLWLSVPTLGFAALAHIAADRWLKRHTHARNPWTVRELAGNRAGGVVLFGLLFLGVCIGFVNPNVDQEDKLSSLLGMLVIAISVIPLTLHTRARLARERLHVRAEAAKGRTRSLERLRRRRNAWREGLQPDHW